LIAAFAFYLFATLTIASAIAVIFARNPVHSVLWLILAFFNAAGLMLLVGAEFIAMLVVIVYVGAVAVLFLFVVMMLDIDFASLRSGFSRNLPFGIIIALVLLVEIVVALFARQAGPHRGGDRAEHRRDRPAALQPLPVRLRNGGPHPVGGDDRRDCSHAPQPPRYAPAKGVEASRPPT
jgi:NADH:ubiquinone oxidoreductase subunit 6 (subunit J)